jgi:hypothetical protein
MVKRKAEYIEGRKARENFERLGLSHAVDYKGVNQVTMRNKGETTTCSGLVSQADTHIVMFFSRLPFSSIAARAKRRRSQTGTFVPLPGKYQ